MRINKFISLHTGYSRRKADQLIDEKRVKLNGKILTKLGTVVDIESDTVEIDDKKVEISNEKNYIALNKPAGYVTTREDELNRKTVMELIPQIPNLKPVGRFDKETEGLLLFSNDGDFINKLTHPKFECEKEYYVEIKGKLERKNKELLENGIILDGKKTMKAKIMIKNTDINKTILIITIKEGRKRQIRKMFDYIKHPVKYLKRLRIGSIKLGSLKKGEFRFLNKKEINVN